MLTIYPIHEKELTKFHRNHYVLSVTALEDTSIFKDGDIENDNHVSIESFKQCFPFASQKKIAAILLTHLQIKIQEGQDNFLFAYNEKNKEESFDILGGLLDVFQIEPDTHEQKLQFESIKTHGLTWRYLLIGADTYFNSVKPVCLH